MCAYSEKLEFSLAYLKMRLFPHENVHFGQNVGDVCYVGQYMSKSLKSIYYV